MKVWAAEVVREAIIKEYKRDPGDILSIHGEGILVKCGEGAVILRDIDVEGAEGTGILPMLDM